MVNDNMTKATAVGYPMCPVHSLPKKVAMESKGHIGFCNSEVKEINMISAQKVSPPLTLL